LSAHMHNFGLLLSVAVLWALAAISPGPNFVMTVRVSITRSRRDGISAVAGIGLGTVIWGVAGCFGVQALFLAAPWMYLTLKLLGALYLIFLGIKLIWGSLREAERDQVQIEQAKSKNSAFWLGMATTIANPRSAVSVASIFATTMPAHPSTALSLAVVAVMVAVSVGWYSMVVCLFTLRQLAAAYQRSRHWIERFTGACFIFFGVRLAAER
jgi:threonine efflux protein